METQLLSFEYRTEHPEDLENFLSEVLQLDIKSSSTGLFSVQFGNIVMDVVQGTSFGGTMQVALAPENFNDLPARWEFFTFRYSERPTVNFVKSLAVFQMKDGSVWKITAAPLSFRHENSEIPVRNF